MSNERYQLSQLTMWSLNLCFWCPENKFDNWSWLTKELCSPPSHHHQPPFINHGSSTTSHQPPSINHQPSTTIHQPSTTSHHPSTTSHQPPAINHHPSTTSHQPPSINHQDVHVCSSNHLTTNKPKLNMKNLCEEVHSYLSHYWRTLWLSPRF